MAMLMNAMESENHAKSAFFLDDDPLSYGVHSYYSPYTYTSQEPTLLPLETKHAYGNVPFFSETKCTKSSLYKTELCKRFSEFGICRYGAKCQFAHGAIELRQVVRHPKYKTIKCKSYWGSGHCPYGSRCRFIHEEVHDSTCLSLERSKSDPTSAFPVKTHVNYEEGLLLGKQECSISGESAGNLLWKHGQVQEVQSEGCLRVLPNIQEAVDMLLKLSVCEDKEKKLGTISAVPQIKGEEKEENKEKDSDILWKQFHPEAFITPEEESSQWSMDSKDDISRLRVFERFY